jgi:glycosyltransferase involved in cell wall biosynthesis
VPAGALRTQWSVMIPTYNCASYLRQTLASVLAQDAGAEKMQIEVLDDCSTRDDPQAVVAEVGQGRVAFFRHKQNLGPVGNFNACLERSHGELVHLLHGDDYVLPGFYAAVGAVFDQHPDVALVVTRSFVVDEDGEIDILSPRLPQWEKTVTHAPGQMMYSNDVCTPAAVMRRSFYEQHGGFLPSLIHSADWEMWLRACALGGAKAINQPLAAYRIFAGNHTSLLKRTAQNLRDSLQLGEMTAAYGGQAFELSQFRRCLSDAARRQVTLFRELHDVEAVEANRALWKELTPISRRVLIHLSDFARRWY